MKVEGVVCMVKSSKKNLENKNRDEAIKRSLLERAEN